MNNAVQLKPSDRMNDTIHLRINDKTKSRLVMQAKQADLPLSAYIRLLLDKGSWEVALKMKVK